jgi:hypothetical protein
MAAYSASKVANYSWTEFSIGGIIGKAWRFNRTLTAAVLLNAAFIPITLLLMVIDPVTITGVNGWTKPLKFSISIAVYSATLLWFLTYVPRRKLWVGLVATTIGAFLLLENVLIVIQILRRTTSHFNNATPFDAAIFSAMGTMIMVVALLNLVVAIWLVLARIDNRVMAAGLRWGVWITLLGMVVTIFMVMPTASQQAELAQGGTPAVLGAHSVGKEDGGPGLPLLGWSTTAGDLRVGHFIGLHAMQVLPLAAWLLQRAWATTRWSERQRRRMVGVAGIFYTGVVLLVTWQALRGQSVVAPDTATLLATFGLIGSCTAAWVTISAQRTTEAQP